MPKIDENIKCHFFEYDCVYPIPKKDLEDALANWDEEMDGDTLHQIPVSDSAMCTNCMLATLIELINLKLK
jgi:hypothetical protein